MFDYAGARKDGYTDEEIQQATGVDIAKIRADGYGDNEIASAFKTFSIPKKKTGNLLMDTDFTQKPKYALPKQAPEDTKTTAPQRFAKEEEYKDYGRTSRAFKVAKQKSKYGMPTEREVKIAEEQISAPTQLELSDEGKPTTGGLEYPWVSPDFALAGGLRAAGGALAKAPEVVAAGKGFAAGSIGGDVAAWTAHETVDKSLSDEFKQAHPVLSETMKVAAALTGGIAGGMAAERRYMQQYQNLIDDVKEGAIPPQQAEEILRQDSGVSDIINKVEATRAKYAEERATQEAMQADEAVQPEAIAQAEQPSVSPIMEKVNAKLQEMGHEPIIKPMPAQAQRVDEAGEALDDFGQPLFSKTKEEVEDETLSRILKPKGEFEGVGVESGTVKPNGISKLKSEYGSHRYVYTKDGEIISALQVVSKDGKAGTVANVYTKPSERMQGVAKSLYNQAKADFKELKHSEDLTASGVKFKESVEAHPLKSSFATQDGTTTQSVHTIARKFLGKQYNKLKDDLNIVQTFDDLPEDLRKRTGLDTVDVGGKPRGIYDPVTGKAHLIADAMSDKEVQSVVAHELLHRHINSGRQVLGANYDTYVLRLKQLKEDPLVKEAMDAVRSAGTPVKHMNEETMAYLVEKYQYAKDISPKLKRFISDIVERVKVFIAETATKLGVKPEWLISKMSADEIAQVLKSAAIKSAKAEPIQTLKQAEELTFSKAKEVINKLPEGVKKQEAKKDLLELKTVQKNYDDFTEWFRQKFHDMYRPIVKMQQELGIEEGSMIKWDVAGHRLVSKSKAAFKMGEVTERVRQIEKRIVESAKKLQAQPDELRHLIDQYLISKHAPEYNRAIGEDLLGGAAGRSTKEAEEVIRAIGSNREVYKEVRKFSKEMQAMAKESLDILLDAGVLNKEQYDKIRGKYKYYVPMHRIMPDDKDIRPLLGGSGANVKGTGIKKRVGSRELEVADIMSNIMFTTKSAIDRANKNKNAVRLYELLQQVKNPHSPMHSPEIARTFEIESPKVVGVDSNGIPIMQHVSDDKRTLFFRVDGKPKYIKFKNQAMADAALELDYYMYLPWVAEISRWMGAMYTRFNVGFAPRNFIRDTQEMGIFLSSLPDMGYKGAAKASSLAPRALKGIYDEMKGKENEWSKLYRQLKEDGGTMGGYHALSKKDIEVNVEEIAKEVQDIRANTEGARRVLKKIFTTVDNYNQVFEDANRLAAYKSALDMGISRDRAAWIARNATIDFDRKGQATRMLSQLYIFFNPSIQGTAKLFRALKNPKVAVPVVASVGSAVFALNAYNDSIDKDWRKKVSPYDLKSSLVILIPGKEFAYAVIPLAWGVRPIYQAFNEAYSITKGEAKDASERIGEIAKTFFDAYSPIQGNTFLSTLTPTVLDPLVDVYTNEKSLGGMIRPDWMKELPQSEQVFKKKGEEKPSIDQTASGRIMHMTTEGLSNIGIEFSPHDVDYALGSYFGGPYKLAKQGIDNVVAPITGDKVPPKGIPIVGDFYKKPEPEIIEKREKGKPYRELVKKLKGAEPSERKILIVEYLNKVEDADQRKSVLFKLMSGGFDTKGISPSAHPKFPVTKRVNGKIKQVTKDDIMLYHLRIGATRSEAKKLADEWEKQ